MQLHRHFSNVRKSAWLALALVLVILVHHGEQVLRQHPVPKAPPAKGGTNPVTLVFARDLVNGRPFSIDSEFVAGRDRVHAYAEIPGRVSRELVWYRGGDPVAHIRCAVAPVCQGSLPPDSLSPGDWSVDLVEGRTLLASRQFRMISE
ncbi:MAG TPA: hypothetical protein VLM37_11625 [Fibrobacteraceae bacterium]|nr:hypothetical protein [Fibrobacteraceae bacterium]